MDDNAENGDSATALTPLLLSDRLYLVNFSHGTDYIGKHILNVHGADSWLWAARGRLQRFLTSKWGHYAVIILVSLDVAGIFADFLLSLHICEHAGEKGFHEKEWDIAVEALDVTSLVFSCLFMLELLCSVWAFGLELRHPPLQHLSLTGPERSEQLLTYTPTLFQILQIKIPHLRRHRHRRGLHR
jgi:hypothetical protein